MWISSLVKYTIQKTKNKEKEKRKNEEIKRKFKRNKSERKKKKTIDRLKKMFIIKAIRNEKKIKRKESESIC